MVKMTKKELEAMAPEARHQMFVEMVQELEGHPEKLRAYLDIRVLDAEYGYCKMEMPISMKHQNPLATVHGGAVYSLCDTCGGSCNYTLGESGPTISADIHYVGSAVGAKKLVAECHAIKIGKRINVLEEKVYNEKGDLIAVCTQQYMNPGKEAWLIWEE